MNYVPLTSCPVSPGSPPRKRLVSSLKPDSKAGTYEIAPREKNRGKGLPDYVSHSKGAAIHGTRPSRGAREIARQGLPPKPQGDSVGGRQDPAPNNGGRFEREQAPHTERLPHEVFRKAREPRRRGVDFGLKGMAARRPRFKPEYGGRGLLARDDYSNQPEQSRMSRASTSMPLPDAFHTPIFEPLKTLPTRFSSPPLIEGLLQSIHDVLGPNARPSPIQSLALKHLFSLPHHIESEKPRERSASSDFTPPAPWPLVWRQHLIAAETGSGKSIAYLLPMLQHLKLTEDDPTPLHATLFPSRPLPLSPRGVILAPTHELARQLTTFAKVLLHHSRLRVLCASRANTASSMRGRSTARQLKRDIDETFAVSGTGPVGLHRNRPVDVVVGTTTKILEMARGLGWDRAARIEEHWDDDRKERARQWIPGPPELGLAGVEWVVIDEADVLFDRDFEASTRLLLADIARARGYTHPSFAALDLGSGISVPPPSEPVAYPFHLSLVSATIPTSFANYLSVAHPNLTRLASPRLHRLPPTLATEHQVWTSGSKNADIEKRIRRVWAEDVQSSAKTRSKVLVFCNKSSKVKDLGHYLDEKGIPNIALTSESDARSRGSNRHLEGFLKTNEEARVSPTPSPSPLPAPADLSLRPSASISSPTESHVLITTSLLSRGLDFSSQVRYVFIADTPRNMIDFLHRAGRAGRAGNVGRVVIFGKSKGRGADESRKLRRQVGAVVR